MGADETSGNEANGGALAAPAFPRHEQTFPMLTPQEIVDLLNREINAALADPTIKARFGELGAIPITGDARQFGAMLATETERWRKVVEISGQKKP